MTTLLQGAPDSDKFELVKSGKATVNYLSTDTIRQQSFHHNLGYIPITLVYLNGWTLASNSFVPLPAQLGFSFSGGYVVTDIQTTFFVDAIQLVINIASGSASVAYAGPFTYRYFLFRYPANAS